MQNKFENSNSLYLMQLNSIYRGKKEINLLYISNRGDVKESRYSRYKRLTEMS